MSNGSFSVRLSSPYPAAPVRLPSNRDSTCSHIRCRAQVGGRAGAACRGATRPPAAGPDGGIQRQRCPERSEVELPCAAGTAKRSGMATRPRSACRTKRAEPEKIGIAVDGPLTFDSGGMVVGADRKSEPYFLRHVRPSWFATSLASASEYSTSTTCCSSVSGRSAAHLSEEVLRTDSMIIRLDWGLNQTWPV